MTTRVTIEAHGESYPVLVQKRTPEGDLAWSEILADGDSKTIDHIGDGWLTITEVYVEGGYVPGTPLPTPETVSAASQAIEVAAPHGIFRGDDRGLGQGGSLDLDALKAADTVEAEVIPAASTAIAQAEADAQGATSTPVEAAPVTAQSAEGNSTGEPQTFSGSVVGSGPAEGNISTSTPEGLTEQPSSSGTEQSLSDGGQPDQNPVDDQNHQG